jgi:hypothetical protein
MLLESGTRWTVAPYAATQITVENPAEDAVSVRVGAAAPVEIKPRERVQLARDLAAETLVECFGPGVAELSWLVAPGETAAPQQDHAVPGVLGVLDDPWRKAITEAWKNAFEQSSPPAVRLPAQLGRFEPTTLPNTTNIEMRKSFPSICPRPGRSGSSVPVGNGKVDLTNLRLNNLSTARWDGDPAFSDADRNVTFTFRVDTLRLTGDCTMKQGCCRAMLGFCVTPHDCSGWQGFELSMDAAVVRFQATAVDDPTGLQVSVTDTVLDIQGAKTVRFPGNVPEWVNYILGTWGTVQEFKTATELASRQAVSQPVVRSVIQEVVNRWISELGPSTTPSAYRTPSGKP